MSAATIKRSDVLFAAQNLTKFCDDPGPVHWQGVMKVLRYFWQTKNLGVTYGEVTSRDVTMSAYVYSDHATCPDSRRPVSGRAVMLCLGASSWFSAEGNIVGVIRVGLCSAYESRECNKVTSIYHTYIKELHDSNYGG